MEGFELRHFDLRELYYFIAVAEELHFARAAERVGINQSPLSKAITLMERNLGVRLFVRDRRSTKLTEIGQILLDDARRVLAEADQARRSILAAAAGMVGRLRIAITDGLAQPRLAALLRKTYQEHANIDIHVVQRPFPEQLRMLRSGMLDIGIMVTAPDIHELENSGRSSSTVLNGLGDDLRATAIWNEKLSVVMERAHPLAGGSAVDWDGLADAKLITVGEQLSACEAGSSLIGLRAPARRLESVASLTLVLTLAAAGKAIGVLGAGAASTVQRSDLAILPLSGRRTKVTAYVVRRADTESALVDRFIERATAIV